MRITFVNMETQIFFTSRGYFFVVCKSTGTTGSVAFNGAKLLVVDVD